MKLAVVGAPSTSLNHDNRNMGRKRRHHLIIGRYGLAGAVDFSGYPQGTVTIDLGGLILGVLIGPWGFRVDNSTGIGTVFGGFTTFSSSTTVVVDLGAVFARVMTERDATRESLGSTGSRSQPQERHHPEPSGRRESAR